MNMSVTRPPITTGPTRVAGDNLITLNRANFEVALNTQGPVIVEFMSYGCGHCRAAEPAVQQVAAELEGDATFFRVNVPAERELSARYGIRGTPTFIMFEDGQEVGRAVGPGSSVDAILAAVTRPFGLTP